MIQHSFFAGCILMGLAAMPPEPLLPAPTPEQLAWQEMEYGMFCHFSINTFPSAQTDHTVKASPWRDGRGDVVKEVADACHAQGVMFGFYLSPWDRHEPKYADSAAYDEYFKAQLRELLTGYGPVGEVWFDGAGGTAARADGGRGPRDGLSGEP